MSDEDKPLELDPEYVREKAAKQAAAAAPVKPSRKVAVVILSAVMAAVLVVIVLMVMQRQPTAKGASVPDGVVISVTSPKPGVPITIDGVKAGKTPQALKFKGRTRPITIRGNGVEKTVTPDHDQIVNLAP
ncbi:MAG: PEGA domain-containing protein [Deltaproteobacteria bacterium]|nr:PEGA domain-containing protein [Deltaproteobacteria bacterium]